MINMLAIAFRGIETDEKISIGPVINSTSNMLARHGRYRHKHDV